MISRRVVCLALCLVGITRLPARAQSLLYPGDATRRALLDSLAFQASGLTLGNAVGRRAIYEFYDYQCVFCREMEPAVERVVAEHPDVKLILKPWPLFGSHSIYAARAIFAAAWQGRLDPAHAALFVAKGPLNRERVRQILAHAGVNLKKLDSELLTRSGEIDQNLRVVRGQARALGFRGTPGLVVNGHVVPGALAYEDLKSLVDSPRPSEKTN